MSLKVTRLDHLGIIAGVIKDLGLVEMIDARLGFTERQEISPGEAVAGMILNALGFTSKPLSLTPKFFESKPLNLLFRDGVTQEHFNRSKLGRTLDQIYKYNCSKLFYELSLACCLQEKVDLRFNSLDTTTLSLHGKYMDDSDEQAIKITHGYSKDHRADLKQVVQELMVSQDGGVPLIMQSWDGNANDSKIFKIRCKEVLNAFANSDAPRYLIADSKLYSKENAENLAKIYYITRIPRSIKQKKSTISKALSTPKDQWTDIDGSNTYYKVEITHYGIKQRWIVIKSNAAESRATKRIGKALVAEEQSINSYNKKFEKELFCCKDDALKASATITKKLKYYKVERTSILPEGNEFKLHLVVTRDQEAIAAEVALKSCYVLGSNIPTAELSDLDLIKAYKNQNSTIENQGFRFLKDPLFFTSSLFLKKASRIEGLVTIMTFSLLVYAIAQRRARMLLHELEETIPNQINQPSSRPTCRWIFQLLEGINVIALELNNSIRMFIEGLTPLRRKIIGLFGETVEKIYSGLESADLVSYTT